MNMTWSVGNHLKGFWTLRRSQRDSLPGFEDENCIYNYKEMNSANNYVSWEDKFETQMRTLTWPIPWLQVLRYPKQRPN